MPEEQPRYLQYGEQGAKFRQALIEKMAEAWNGGKSSTAAPINYEREVELYRLPTSPAALEAYKLGGTIEEAEEANRLWAQGMKQQQAEMKAQGAKPADIAAAGLSDEQIFAACRKHAFELGRQASRDDPERENAYHEKMTAKLTKLRGGMSYETVGEEAPDAAG